MRAFLDAAQDDLLRRIFYIIIYYPAALRQDNGPASISRWLSRDAGQGHLTISIWRAAWISCHARVYHFDFAIV